MVSAASVLPTALSAVGTGVSVVGALRQGKAAQSAGNFNQKVAAENAEIAREQTKLEAQQIERQTRMRIGAIEAAAGGAGVMPEGSVMDVLSDVVAQSELEQANALHIGELRARGFNQTASIEGARARNSRTSSFVRAGTALLSGGANTFQLADEAGLFKLKREG